MALITQISSIVNDAVADALGKNATPTLLESSDIVSMGKAISQFDAYEGFFKSLVNRIVRTVYFVRTYEGSDRRILRDEHEYGAFIQKVYYSDVEASDNPTYDYSGAGGAFVQQSPYGVSQQVTVQSLIYGGKGTWTLEIVRPIPQIASAFTSEAAMLAFIDGMYMYVNNKFKLEEERIVALAANTAMAAAINGGHARNLLAEYNAAHTGAVLTVDHALESADFLKYASKEISRTIDNMGKMSTVFNVEGYETFTSKENLVVEMNTEFTKASDMYLQADTFHNELVALPGYTSVPYWQSSGKAFKFVDTSAISIKHDDFETEANPTGEITQSGIICFLHDIENCAAYFGRRRTWELYNPRAEVMNHGEKAEKGFAVDNHANAVVFYIANNNVQVNVSTENWSAAQLIGGKSASNLQENIVIDNTNRTISGTLKYVTGYTQFSGDVSEQSGNYLVIKLQPTPTADVYIKKTENAEWKKLDSDYICIFRITDTSEQKIYVKAVEDGQDNFYTYSLTGLTLASA